MDIELLNSYKRPFVKKRYLQTILGGLNLKIGNNAPIYAYLIQVVVFIIPWVLGGFLTFLLEFQILGGDVSVYIYSAIYGLLVFLFVLVTQLTSLLLQRRTSEVTRLTDGVQNILSEEDEIEFDSCLSPHVVQYLVPNKQFKVNIIFHSLLSGILCGLGLLYLTPSTFYSLYSNTVITVIWYIGGWFVLCVAQYSLTIRAPPELATFRTTDVAEVASLSRPFYVFLFLLVDTLWRCFPALNFILLNQILHIVFITLPVFWSLGFLPPLEALALWFMEQVLVHALGGSPMATNLRLTGMLFVSCCSVGICSVLPSILPVILFCALIGYILSVDIAGLVNFLLEKLWSSLNKTGNKGAGLVREEVMFIQHGSHWVLVVIHHAVLLVITGGITVGMYYYSESFSDAIWQILGISIILAAKMETWLRQFQQVYVFGIFRNCLYPRDVNNREKFKKRKRKLRVIGIFHKFVMNFLMPLVMVVYVSLGISVSAASAPSFSLALGSFRAFRWIWQSTSNSLLEISVVHFVNSVIQPSPMSTWTTMGIGLQLMLVGFARDRLFQLLHKLYVYLTILVTSYTVKKQRRSSTVPLIVVSAFLFPVTFLLILTAATLSAPLLPLFTLPVLLVGFPRPMRSWPGGVGDSASVCSDTIYYTEMVPQVAAAFRRALSAGSLGTPQPGYFYLLRFQDRMLWVQVLECGFGFYSLSIKGMELQETSCHTVEASELEAQFDVAFENELAGCCSVNPYIAHTVTPMDVVNFSTYSDAKSTLTGIIDSPDTLARISEGFYKTLVWVLARHIVERKDYSPRKASSRSLQGKAPASISSPLRTNRAESRASSSSHPQANLKKEPTVREPCPSKDSGHPESSQSRPQSVISYQVKKAPSWSSLGSFSDEGLELDNVETKKTKAKSRLSSDDLFDDLPGTVKVEDEEDDLLKELDFGLPVVDKGTPKHGPLESKNFEQRGVGIKLANSVQFKSSHSSRLSLPFKWREIPMDPGILQPLLEHFPTDWFKSVLLHLQLETGEKSSQEVAEEMISDPALLEMYSYLTVACHLVFCGDSLVAGKDGPWHVYRAYSGDPPWSPQLEWLSEDDELFAIAKQAFRLAFKLAYDQIVLGEGDEDEDLIANLEDYESNWYLGSDADQEWKDAVKQQKPELFSLMFNPQESTYHGRVLSHQPVLASVGSLNQEMVRALWSSLSLELFYMTNDDEERYSIQAHPIILRNLTVQSADPPLGYPIYSSPPISIPTL